MERGPEVISLKTTHLLSDEPRIFTLSMPVLSTTLLSIHLRNNLTGSLPPIPSLLVATPYANFAYFVESGLLEGKSSFLLWAADVWRKWDIKPCGEFFSFSSSSNREYYNDLQRHVESKLCCKCLSHGPAKNHKEKMQKV